MKIKDAIQQRKFQNEWHKLRVNLLYSSSWLSGNIKAFIEPFGITQKQFNILRILRGQHPEEITILDIRNRMIDKMSDASRMVDRLAKKDLLLKRPCTEDKRQTRVRISPAGLELLQQIDSEMNRMDEILFNLSEEEAHTLNHLLDKMRGCKDQARK